MILDERKRRILQAIIDDYINTAEPIGSRTIARKHELGLSSATIRNEMADLEDMGFLAQPHTSAGRVPSDKGYRLYVDQLMPVVEITHEEADAIRIAMEVRINEMSQLIRQASAVLSKFTRYTSMAITPQIKKSYLKALQVVPVDAGKALVIVVTNAGLVRNTLVNLNMEVKPEILISISNILNERLSGLAIDQFNATIIKELEEQTGIPKDILFPVLEAAADCINHIDHPEVYMDGATNIFNYPEFRDILKAKEFMSIMDEKANLFRLLNDCIDNMGISIKIGAENDISGIKDCSIVTANYTMGGNLIGTIGIIGPTRMEYPRVISSMSYIRKMINEEITRLMGVKPDNTG